MLAMVITYPRSKLPLQPDVPHAKHFTGAPAVHLWQSPPYLLLKPASQE